MPEQQSSSQMNLADDLLVGAKAIAGYIGLAERQVFHGHKIRALPTFKIGALIAARKSELSRQLSASAA